MRKLPCLVSLLPVLLGAAASAASAPQLLPLPKTLTLGEGVLTLNQDSRIVADSADLEPLAKLLASEIQQTTGVSISTEARKPSGAGVGARPMGYHYPVDIVLRLEPKLKGEAYTLDAEESVTPISTTGGGHDCWRFLSERGFRHGDIAASGARFRFFANDSEDAYSG